MSRMMIQAAVTMNQLQHKLDLIGQNMANSQTAGYKAKQTEFSSLLYQQINNLNAPENAVNRLTPEGIRVGSGARLGEIKDNFSLGAFQTTDRVLDTALRNENHYFQIEVQENGGTEIRYTRDGAFYLSTEENDTVMLTDGAGNPVLGQDGPIVIQNGFDSINIRDNGEISVLRNGQTEIAGQIEIAEITRPRLLEHAEANLYRLPENAGAALDELVVIQDPDSGFLDSGMLEQSNVDIAKEMTDLLIAQRAYQFNSRTISTSDQMMGLVNQLRS